MGLFNFGKKFIERCPLALPICAALYGICGRNRKKIRGRSNEIDAKEAFLRQNRITIRGNNNKITVGKKCLLKGCRFSIVGNDNVIKIGDMTAANKVLFCIENNNNHITVGSHCLFAGSAQLAAIEGTDICIGDNCLLSGDIVFRTGDSHSMLDSDAQRINPSQDIVVGNHVWIGYRAFINKGVRIMKDSIVGTGAVVTRKFHEGGIVIAGVPASAVKRDISWDINRI